MYFVDREKIEKILQFLEEDIKLFNQQESWTSNIEKKALERIAQLMIEAILDVGNAMIDGFIMRDPGSYDDIIDILDDEKVISGDSAKGLKHFIRYRKALVQEYVMINDAELSEMVHVTLPHLQSFPNSVRVYLENELGPVSAFKK